MEPVLELSGAVVAEVVENKAVLLVPVEELPAYRVVVVVLLVQVQVQGKQVIPVQIVLFLVAWDWKMTVVL